MHIHFLQHVPFEGLGYIEEWARINAHTVGRTALYAEEDLPARSAFDFLVIMGGPMGVHDTGLYPWLIEEIDFIREWIQSGGKTLGVCLGAQLIAAGLGAKVFQNPYKEIGWYAVEKVKTPEHPQLSELLPETFLGFHWHGDTFDLPDGAVHLASSEACRHQAFYYPPSTLALQFHLESTQHSIESLIDHCGHELIPSPFIQTGHDMRSKPEFIASSNAIMQNVLDFIAGL